MRTCSNCQTKNGPRAEICVQCKTPFPARTAKKPRKKAAARNLPAVRKPRVDKIPFLPSLAHSADGPCLVMSRGGAFAQLSAAETKRVADTLLMVFEPE